MGSLATALLLGLTSLFSVVSSVNITCAAHEKSREIVCKKIDGASEELNLYNICNGEIFFKTLGYVTNGDKFPCQEYEEEIKVGPDSSFKYVFGHVGAEYRRDLFVSDCRWVSPGKLVILVPCMACLRQVKPESLADNDTDELSEVTTRRIRGRMEIIPYTEFPEFPNY